MTQVAVAEAPSIINDMAKRFGMDKRAFEATLKATVVPGNVSNEQFVAFLLVAKQYNLNPITKEIYAFPAKGGGIQPIVGIDGWCNIINSHPQLNGIKFEDKFAEDGSLISITCRIHRKDREHPTECTEYMSECKKESEPWKKWPARMLRHKSLVQCARYAFSLSGIVDPDEAERMVDVSPEAISPYTVDKTKAASPFKTATLRNQFHKNLKDNIIGAKTAEEISRLVAVNSGKLDEMEASGDERDRQSLDDIYQAIELAQNRFVEADYEEIPAHMHEEFQMPQGI